MLIIKHILTALHHEHVTPRFRSPVAGLPKSQTTQGETKTNLNITSLQSEDFRKKQNESILSYIWTTGHSKLSIRNNPRGHEYVLNGLCRSHVILLC